MGSIFLPLFCLWGFIEIVLWEFEFLSIGVDPVYFVFVLKLFCIFLSAAWTVLMEEISHWWLIFLFLKDRNRVIWVLLRDLCCLGNVWAFLLVCVASCFFLLALKTFWVNTINQFLLVERPHLSLGLLCEQWFESVFDGMFVSFISQFLRYSSPLLSIEFNILNQDKILLFFPIFF